MVNNRTGKPYTKEDIIVKAKEGNFINTDGIRYDLDGKGMAEYLKSLGFNIISYRDTGKHGDVITAENVIMSTNGYCHMSK